MATRLARTFAALTASQLITRAIRVGYLFVLVRYLPPSDVGIYLYGIAFYLTLSVVTGFGQGPMVGALLAEQQDPADYLSKSMSVVVTSTAVGVAGGLGYLWLLEKRTVVSTAGSIFLIALVCRTYIGWIRDLYVAREDVRWVPRYDTTFRLAELVLGVGVLVAGLGLYAVCAAHVGVAVIEAAAYHRKLQLAGVDVKHRVPMREAIEFARRSFVFLISWSLLQMFPQIAIVILTARLGETRSVAQFGVAMQVLGALSIAPAMLGMALVPAISRVRQEGATEVQALELVAKLALLIGAAMAAALNVCAPWAFSTFLGHTYATAGDAMALLGWALAPYALAQIFAPSLNGLGSHRSAAIVAGAMLILQIVVLLLIRDPAGGAPIAVIVGATAGALIAVLAVGRAVTRRWPRLWAAIFIVAVGWGLIYSKVLPRPFDAIIVIAVCGISAFALVTREELAFIRARLPRSSTR